MKNSKAFEKCAVILFLTAFCVLPIALIAKAKIEAASNLERELERDRNSFSRGIDATLEAIRNDQFRDYAYNPPDDDNRSDDQEQEK